MELSDYGLRVKPLEWNCGHAHTPFGMYYSAKYVGGYYWTRNAGLQGEPENSRDFYKEEESMADAQADYERLIAGLLEPIEVKEPAP